jgi:hypothetical protein
MAALWFIVTLLVAAPHVSGRLAPNARCHRQLLQDHSDAPTPGNPQNMIYDVSPAYQAATPAGTLPACRAAAAYTTSP